VRNAVTQWLLKLTLLVFVFLTQPTDRIISCRGSLGQRFTNVFAVTIRGLVCFVPFVTFRFLEKVTK
jgi:hypothetical protein